MNDFQDFKRAAFDMLSLEVEIEEGVFNSVDQKTVLKFQTKWKEFMSNAKIVEYLLARFKLDKNMIQFLNIIVIPTILCTFLPLKALCIQEITLKDIGISVDTFFRMKETLFMDPSIYLSKSKY